MKTTLPIFMLTLLCATFICPRPIFAQHFVDGQMPDTFLRYPKWVSSIAFSPDGTQLASGSFDTTTIRLWNVMTGEHIRTLEGHIGRINSIAFSPDGTQLASGSFDTTIRLWNVMTGEHIRTFEGHTSNIGSIAFSPDGTQLASGSSDTTIRLWDVMTGENLQTRRGLQSSDEDEGFLFNAEYYTWGILTVAFSPDGSTLAIGEGVTHAINNLYLGRPRTWHPHSTISLWNLDSGVSKTLSSPLEGKPFWIDKPYHKDNDGDDGRVDFFVSDCSFSPDGSTLACAVSRDSTFGVDLFDYRSPDSTEEFSLKFDLDNMSYPGQIKITSTDEMHITESAIELWDVTSGSLKATLKGHTGSVRSVAFSPNGAMLASGNQDNTMKLWDVTRQPKAPKPR